MNRGKDCDKGFYLESERDLDNIKGDLMSFTGEIQKVLQKNEEWGNNFTAFLIEEFGLSEDFLADIKRIHGDLEDLFPDTKEEIVMNLKREKFRELVENQEVTDEMTQREHIIEDQGLEVYMPTAYNIEDFE